MRIVTKRLGLTALAGLAVLGLATSEAQAQFFRQSTLGVYSSGVSPNSPFYNPVNPLYRSGPGMPMQQAMYNSFAPLYAASRMPPWMYGYNPYPSPIIGSGGYMPSYSPQMPAYNPYSYAAPMMNPYGAGGYAGGASAANPYAMPGAAGGDPSNPYAAALAASGVGNSNPYTPYSTDPYSGYLYGSAALIQANGALTIDMERARLMRELSDQAHQTTRKAKFDTDAYIAANTPKLYEIIAKNHAALVKRIQQNASSGEIESGKAENVLLDSLVKHQDKKASAGSAPLDEDILKHINITTPKGGNLGLLRNDGQLAWPTALIDLVPEQERGEIEQLAKSLYQLALENNLKPALLRDLEVRVQKLQDMLANKVNEIPSGQFVDARGFLNNFQSAVRALGIRNLAPQYAAWLRFIHRPTTAQEVVDWLNTRGLRIAPATPGDEGAYLAFYAALANYDIALTNQVASR